MNYGHEELLLANGCFEPSQLLRPIERYVRPVLTLCHSCNRCGMHGSNTSGETSSAIASPGLPAKPLCQYQLDALTERVLHGTMSPSLRNFRPNVCILHLLETQAHNLKGASLLPGHGVESILTSHTGPLYQCMCEQETAKLKRDQARCLVLMAHAEQIAHVHRRLQPDACDLAGKCVVATCGQDLWFFSI